MSASQQVKTARHTGSLGHRKRSPLRAHIPAAGPSTSPSGGAAGRPSGKLTQQEFTLGLSCTRKEAMPALAGLGQC